MPTPILMLVVSWYDRLLVSLSRVTQSTSFIPEIDGLRFLAIVPVVFMHISTRLISSHDDWWSQDQLLAGNSLYQLLYKGSAGVHVFFVISGFVLALPFAYGYINRGKPPSIKAYYIRRLVRLEPPFLISMIAFFILSLLVNRLPPDILSRSMLASITYLHYFIYGTWSLINPISWSLETEVQFYILAPALFMIFLVGTPRMRFLLLSILSLILAVFVFFNKRFVLDYHLAKSLLIYIPYFLTGVLLSDLYVRRKSFFETKSMIWDGLGLAGLAGILIFHHYYTWYSSMLQCFSIALVFVAVFKGKMMNVFFTKKEIVVIGGMCYSIYLVHYGFVYGIMSFTGRLTTGTSFHANYFLQLLLILPVLLVISSVFFLFFEKPFMYKEWYRDFPRGYIDRLFK